jgi:uncharacterized PurR-regulated membrane protein YhhQ (DUF165 family)
MQIYKLYQLCSECRLVAVSSISIKDGKLLDILNAHRLVEIFSPQSCYWESQSSLYLGLLVDTVVFIFSCVLLSAFHSQVCEV